MFLIVAASSQLKIFVRIFDNNGNKTHKGFLLRTSDSSLTLSSYKNSFEIPIDKIGSIKLRRSFGHTVLITSLITAGSFAVLGAASANPNAWIFAYTAGEGARAGFLFGAGTGAFWGTIISGIRKRPVFKINGSLEQWKKTQSVWNFYINPHAK